MTVNWNTEKATLSTSITFKDIPMEKYNEIVAYIGKVLGKDKSESKEPEKTNLSETVKAFGEKYEKVGRYKGYEKILAIFSDADKNPAAYSWDYALALKWKSLIPELKDVSDHSVCHVLGSMYKLGLTGKTRKRAPITYQMENYYRVPLPIVSETETSETVMNELPTINEEDKRKGDILRQTRRKAGISVVDMAKMIGYEPSIIHRWELGVYSMSNDAIKEVNKFFGTNIFREGVVKIA